jgi:hypothetical protein
MGGAASRASGVDAAVGGRLGGELFAESRLPYLERYLRRNGVELKIGDDVLPPGMAGGFNAAAKQLLLRTSPTRYEVQHELSHFIQWRKIGHTALPPSIDRPIPSAI